MTEQRSVSFKSWRIAFLVLVLVTVAAWGWNREQKLERRTNWEAPVSLGVIVVQIGEVEPAPVPALGALEADTEAWFKAQSERYRNTLISPVAVHVLGPTKAPGPVPELPLEARFQDQVAYTWDLWRWTSAVDAQLQNPPPLDSRMYLVVRTGPRIQNELFFEGIAEQGGEVGVVEVDFADETVFLAMYTAVHEFLHTLGATDKYSYDGSTITEEGLADPGRVPLYPQTQAEIMGRNIAKSETKFVQPATWNDVVIGEATAAEIGWTKP